MLAHEYQHLLQSYEDPDESVWLDEGPSDWAQTLSGYVDPRRPISEVGLDSHLQCFYGYLAVQTPANPIPRRGGPENGLTVWGDQGGVDGGEILADYGAAYSMMEFLAGRYGPAFLTELHRDDADGLASLDGLLAQVSPPTNARQVIHDWAAMTALDGAPDRNGGRLSGGSANRYQASTLNASVNWSNADAFAARGAPPNGSDFVRLRIGDTRMLSAAQVHSLTFDGGAALVPDSLDWAVDPAPPERPGDPALFSDRDGLGFRLRPDLQPGG